jgi:hypothetical protein
MNVSKNSDPDVGLRKLQYGYKISLVQRLITNLNGNFISVNMPHRIHKCTNTLYGYVVINY